jgi:DNA-binding GntR family transcriptional regulator
MSPAAQKKDARLATDTALLRFLTDAAAPMQAKAIAEAIGLSHKVIRPALNRLRKLELITRIKHAGPTEPHLWSIVR